MSHRRVFMNMMRLGNKKKMLFYEDDLQRLLHTFYTISYGYQFKVQKQVVSRSNLQEFISYKLDVDGISLEQIIYDDSWKSQCQAAKRWEREVTRRIRKPRNWHDI